MGVPAEKVENALWSARRELKYAAEHATPLTEGRIIRLVDDLDRLIDEGAR